MSEQQPKPMDKRIWMILEDDYPLRFMLESMFRLWDSEPLSFANGYDASAWLDQIEAGKMTDPLPEVALLDIRVPGPQGPDIAERMHRIAATSNIAVVIMTAYRLDALEKDKIIAQAQPDDFVNKGSPIFDTLQAVLEGAIKQARARAAALVAEPSPEAPKEPASAVPDAAPPAAKVETPASDGKHPPAKEVKVVASPSVEAAKKASEKPPTPASSDSKPVKAPRKPKPRTTDPQTSGGASSGKPTTKK